MDYFCSIATPTADVHQKIWNFSYLHYSNNLNVLQDVVYSIHLMERFLSAIKKMVGVFVEILVIIIITDFYNFAPFPRKLTMQSKCIITT
jgi:hypothetical protein